MKDSPLREKSMDFAVRIMALAKALRDERKEYAVADQVLRSGTAIGANLAEAAFAPTLRDFLNKCKIALKECSETRYWLDLFSRAALFPDARLAPSAPIATTSSRCSPPRARQWSRACGANKVTSEQ